MKGRSKGRKGWSKGEEGGEEGKRTKVEREEIEGAKSQRREPMDFREFRDKSRRLASKISFPSATTRRPSHLGSTLA